jgi:hypothetical protein
MQEKESQFYINKMTFGFYKGFSLLLRFPNEEMSDNRPYNTPLRTISMDTKRLSRLFMKILDSVYSCTSVH